MTNLFEGYSLEVILIALGAFLLTYLIKFPIKKATSKLSEDKRKMVNFVIVFIPLILSFIASFVYFGIAKKQVLSILSIETAISAFVLSLSLYAVVSRVWIVIKGIASGKVSIDSSLSKEMVEYLKSNIKELLKRVKVDQKELDQVLESLEKLNTLKDLLLSDNINLDAEKLAQVNQDIETFSLRQRELSKEIEDGKLKAKQYSDKLYKA